MLSPAFIPAALALTSHIETTGAPVAVPIQLEMLAVIAASIGGALTARDRELDLIGSAGLAVACSLGGGLLRDIILQVGDVYILRQPLALPISIATAAVVFTAPHVIAKRDRLIAFLDIFAVGLFAATGADKAMVYGFEPLVCVIMGFFTAVGGGMLRDICLGQTPAIFQKSTFYGVASIGGALVYIALAELTGASHIAALTACVAATILLRWLSVRYNIMSPTQVDLHGVARAGKRIARRRAGGRAGNHGKRGRRRRRKR